ncbi:hypothetical protein VNI00_005937 [Paramarasmius palmivorus]|uniref:F-box domain-containing protein n=1 Tax=Paramarasmius palmivorus TaxID=297713 RepID=A0AAW0DGW5_9AGAR
MPTLKEQLEVVDEEIEKTRKHLLGLQSYHNSLLPICRLPDEVLALILKFCVTPTPGSQPAWIRVTHICRHWRRAALECPSMWDTPDFDHPRWAREMLSRAKAAPLRIHAAVNATRKGQQEVLQALQDMTRVSELHIPHRSQQMFSALIQPAPILHSLKLVNYQRPTKLELPENFLAVAPLVFEHYIYNVTTALRLEGLRLLHLNTGDRIPRTDSNFGGFLRALQSMQVLEALELFDFLPYGEPITHNANASTTLHKLRNVMVQGAPSGCVDLLNTITIPSSASVTIVTVVHRGSELIEVLPVLSRFAGIAEDQMNSVYLDLKQIRPHSEFVLKIFDRDLPDEPSYAPSRFMLRLRVLEPIFNHVPDNELNDAAKQVLAVLPLSRLQAVHFALRNGFSAEDFVQRLESLAQLHTIHVAGPCAVAFVEALCRHQGTSSQRPFSPLKARFDRPSAFVEGDTGVAFDRLLCELRQRSERGIAIHSIGIEHAANFDSDRYSRYAFLTSNMDEAPARQENYYSLEPKEKEPVYEVNIDSMANIEEQFRLLDEKIAQTKENLRSLHFQRNALIPICRLPSEILGLILTFCASDERLRRYGTTRLRMSWLWLTHVCQHWRAIALGCPAMWDTPDFSKPSLAREMLVRAKLAPLYIRATVRSDRVDRQEVLRDALRDMTRVAAIEIDTSLPLILDVLSRIIQPAPVLEKLCIYNERSTDRVILPDDFLAGNAPRLREVSLRYCMLHWGHMSKTLSGLRSLYLHGGESNRIPQSDLKAFLQAMQTMQLLQTLNIINVFPDGDSIVLDTITLSKLERVRVVDSINGCISLLNCIASPLAASIDIEGIVSQPGDCKKALAVLPRLFSIVQSRTQSCYICATDDQFEIKMFDQDLPRRPLFENSLFRFELSKRATNPVPLSGSEFYDFTKRFLELLPSLRVPAIYPILGSEFSAEDFSRYFGSLTELHTIAVQGSCAYAFIQAFHSSTSIHPPGDIPFSSLRNIVLKNMDYARCLDAGAWPAAGVRFVHALRHRLAQGKAIHCVNIRTCINFNIEQFDELKDVVRGVYRDGQSSNGDGKELEIDSSD